jgi:methylenetetrahydrofolate dehydrogenase (NADP+)/methenyltetrahydrofolate cyclohydrolase
MAPFAARKVRAGAAAGVEIMPLVLPAGVTTIAAERAFAELLEEGPRDGVFVEFPFPAGVDGDSIVALIPEAEDLDIMTTSRVRRYLAGLDTLPPLTISAGLELLDAYGVETKGLQGIVVAESGPFAQSFREALARRGAAMAPLVPPDDPDLVLRAREAELVVVSAGRPGLIRSEALAPGAVVIDVGYFNAGGRGDVDTTGGCAHLAAIATVPGGIGPMTISVLIERLIEFAERNIGEAPQ